MLTSIDEIIRDGAALADDLERGQAERPLHTWFEEVRRELQAQPLTVTLIASSEAARQAVLGTLVEEAFRSVTIRQTTYPGLLEIVLSGAGYALEAPGGRRAEFAALAALLQALDEVTATPDEAGNDVSIWRVSLRSPPERQGLQLLVPESVEAVGRSPALESVIVARSQVLAVAAGENAPFAGGDFPILQRLCGAIGFALPIAVAPSPELAQSLARELAAARVGTVLPGQSLATIPSLLTVNAPANSLRRQLQHSATAKRLLLACDAIQARYDADSRQLQARRARDEALTRADVGAEGRGRRGHEGLRQRAGDEFASLARIADETSRRALLPDSVVGKRLRELVDEARPEDLRQETDHQQINLTLDARYLHRFEQGLRKAIKEHFKQDMAATREALHALKLRAERELEEAGQPVVVGWLDIGDEDLWRRISELMNFEVRYRGQIPKRGFLQRLGEGRRLVFAVLMVASLLGTLVGVNFREGVFMGVILLAVFIGAVWYSYRSWETQDQSRLESEIQKVRDQLLQEARRLVSDLMQEKRLRISDYIEQQKRHYLQQIDDQARARTEQDTQRAHEQRERARARLRQLDTQLKELQMIAPRIARLKQECSKLQADTERAIRELLAKGGASA